MSAPAIRLARAGDAVAISAVIVAALRVSNAADYPPEVIARVAAGFDAEAVQGMIGRRQVLIARDGGRVVGTAALDGDTVRSVFVLPEAQRRGIGTALMAEIVRMAGHQGHAALRLRSSLTARAFYERHAFRALGEAVFGEERTILMERDLGTPFASTRRM